MVVLFYLFKKKFLSSFITKFGKILLLHDHLLLQNPKENIDYGQHDPPTLLFFSQGFKKENDF
jgi:hypothetical protein